MANRCPKPWLGALLLMLIAASTVGCNRDKLPTVPLHGRVTWDGKPLPDGTVAFTPIKLAEGLPRRPAVGTVAPDGTYQLSSFSKGDGIMPGQYAVTVHSYTSQPTLDKPDQPMIWRIPKRYGDPAKSGIRFNMPENARGPLTFNIDLEN